MEKEVIVKRFLEAYSSFKNEHLENRFLSFDQLEPQLKKLESCFEIKEIGRSFLNVPIHSVKAGNGSVKILAWSQMHGNESTSTRAVMDLLSFFVHEKEGLAANILNKCTFMVIPMLNPDGAARYTRENVNKVDLNRDADQLTQPESKVLRSCFKDFSPDFCFNLHDQRTIFGAGNTAKPATLSFLAPSMDVERSVSPSRLKAMQVIVAIGEGLEVVMPGQTGRFDDSFNINCTGDYFQSLEVPTILFEAGHYQRDYRREETRRYFSLALYIAIHTIIENKLEQYSEQDYFKIPENQKSFLDLVLRDATVAGVQTDVGIQFSEKMKAGNVIFEPVITTMAPKLSLFGHREIECHGQELKLVTGELPRENDIVNKILLNNEKLSINP